MYSTSQPEIAPQRSVDSATLSLVAGLFRRLVGEGIEYRHWKRNEHLPPATCGETNLDILVDGSDSLRIAQILSETGYKQFTASTEGAQPGVEEYLGFYDETGKLDHPHLPLLVIEFLGLPGAGKSTLAKRLLSRLSARGIPAGDRRSVARLKGGRAEHFAQLAKFSLKRGRVFRPAARLAASAAPWSPLCWWFAAELALWSYRLSMIHKRTFDILVLDHGPLQSAWCVLLEGPLRDELALSDALTYLLARRQLQLAFVYLDAPPELASRRIETRGPMNRPFHRGRAETERLLSSHREVLDRILEIAERRTGAPVLRLDGAAPVDENDRRLDRFLEQLTQRNVPAA